MYLDNKDSISLSDLIYWVKKELFLPLEKNENPVPLFMIDEITVEVNFVVSGASKGGFDLKVVSLEGDVSEERVQKATVHMRPIIPMSVLSERLQKDPEERERILDNSIKVLYKGSYGSEDVPPERK